jgi:hypothetical protein
VSGDLVNGQGKSVVFGRMSFFVAGLGRQAEGGMKNVTTRRMRAKES